MNNRFKFRIWAKPHEPTKTDGYYLDDADYMVLHPDGKIDIEYYCDNGYIQSFEQDEVIIEQCTGLKDKNGKLIYEGDVLEVSVFDKNNCHSKKKTRWSVEYKIFNNNTGFMVYGINRRWHALMTSNMLYNAEAVVIGNIHENEDLLEVNND